MALEAGSTLGPYRIVSPLGAGGMGEVYRAHDPRLERDVAIKVLPEHFLEDSDSLARFQAEAKAIASLSHPNIVAIHDTGQQGKRLYVVTELLEGETMRSRLRQGPFGVRKAAEHAARVAEGLAAAHEKGLVHRDVKPENLFLLNDGRVKILDFGLARQDPLLAGAGDLSSSPTAARPTNPGAMIGTVGYLAPEQARGEVADHRADIFSLGAVLHEMLVGRRAFHGTSPAELISSILRDEPSPPSDSDPRIPKALDLIVQHCLEKNPDERFQSARDLAFHLDSLGGSVTQRGVIEPLKERRRWPRLVPLGLAALVLTGVAFEVGRHVGGRGGSAAGFAPSSFVQLTDLPGQERQAQIGPMATAFAVRGQRVGESGHLPPARRRPQPGQPHPGQPGSGHGSRVLSRRRAHRLPVRARRRRHLRDGLDGESVKRLTDFGHDPSWSPDGKQIVFSSGTGQNPWSRNALAQLWVVPSSGGEVRQLTKGGDAVQPSWSPGGRRIAFWGLRHDSGQRDLWTIPADGAEDATPVEVTNDPAVDWDPAWSPDGRTLFFASVRGGSMNLWRIDIDEASGRPRGEPVPMTTPSRMSGSISLSRDGRHLMYVSSDERSTIERFGFDPATGRVREPPRPVFQGSRVIYTQDLSPSGEWVVFSTLGVREDLFLVRADGSGYRQITDDAYRDRGPKWSPDGSRIGFYSDRSGRYETWTILPDGSRLEVQTKTTGPSRWDAEWSPDGKSLVTTDGVRTWIEDLTKPLAERKAEPLPPSRSSVPCCPGRGRPTARRSPGTSTSTCRPTASRSSTRSPRASTGPCPRAGARRRGCPTAAACSWPSTTGSCCVDTRTGRAGLVLAAPAQGISISRDDRWVTYIEPHAEADVWMATLEP